VSDYPYLRAALLTVVIGVAALSGAGYAVAQVVDMELGEAGAAVTVGYVVGGAVAVLGTWLQPKGDR
jgi:hypothetical protein